MKKVIFLIGIAFCIACNQIDKKVEKEKENKPAAPSKLENFITSFLKQHPHISENDIYNEEAQADFLKKASSFIIDSGGVATIPMELISSQKNPNGKGYITHLQNLTSHDNKVLEKLHIDIFILSDKQAALKYKMNTKYFIKNAKKIRYLKSEMIRFFTGDNIWTDKAKIETREYNEDYSFGNYAVEL